MELMLGKGSLACRWHGKCILRPPPDACLAWGNFFTATASYSPRISAPSLPQNKQPHTQFLFPAKPSKMCWLGETEVPALAGKAKQCFHFRSWVRPSCRTIASNFFLRRLEVLIISTCSLESPAMFLQDGMGGSGMSTRRFRVWRLDAIQCRHSLRLTPLNARAHCKTFNPDTQFDEFVRKHILQCQPLLPKVLCLSGLLNRRVIVEKKCS